MFLVMFRFWCKTVREDLVQPWFNLSIQNFNPERELHEFRSFPSVSHLIDFAILINVNGH